MIWPLICPWFDSLLNLCGSRFKLLYQYPVSMPDLEAWARDGPEMGQMILAHRLASGLHLLSQNLTQSARTDVEPGWVLHNMIWAVCGRTQLSESRKLVVGQLCSARTGADDSCTLACLQTRYIWPKPDQAIQIRSGTVLHNMIRAFYRKTDPKSDPGIYDLAWSWLHADRNGHNWP